MFWLSYFHPPPPPRMSDVRNSGLTRSLIALFIFFKSQAIIPRLDRCQQRGLLLCSSNPHLPVEKEPLRSVDWSMWTLCRRLPLRASQRRNEEVLQQPQEYWLEPLLELSALPWRLQVGSSACAVHVWPWLLYIPGNRRRYSVLEEFRKN